MGHSKKMTTQEGTTSHCNSIIHRVNKRVDCRPKPKTTIESLPLDLLVDILARVASSSFTDFINTKICCKNFLKSGEDDYIYQHVTMDKFPVVHWKTPSDQMASFLTNCLEKGNPEALFRQGMKEYFKEVKVESGMNYLKRASEKGHTTATYVYCMILFSLGDESMSRQALDLLNSIGYSRPSNWKVCELRDRYQSILFQLWVNNYISQQEVSFKSYDDCMWYDEFIAFRNHINGSS